MAWLQVEQTLPKHRKTLALAEALDVDLPVAVGHLVVFWLWALDHAQDGSLAGMSPRSIARAAEWKGDPSLFATALERAGFLDRDAEGHLRIHDWEEYAGRLIERRQREAERKRAERQKAAGSGEDVRDAYCGRTQDVAPASAGRPQDVRRTSGGHHEDVQRTSWPNTNQYLNHKDLYTDTTDLQETAVSSPPTLSVGDSSVGRSVEDTPTGEMAAEATAAMAETAAAAQEELPAADPEAIPPSPPSPEDAEIAAMEEAAAEIAAAWERVIGAAISPVQAELLGAEALRRGRDVILHAIEVTARARDAGRIRGSPMAYLAGILRAWDGLRLTTLDAILAHEAQRQAGVQTQEEVDAPPRKGRLKRYLHADLPGGYMDVWVQ